jgi:prepilin-type processing-associated H-X9-DG protein
MNLRSFEAMAGLVGLSIVLIAAVPGFFEAVFALAIGWLKYPLSVLPSMRWDVAGILTAIVCLTPFVWGLHRLCACFSIQKVKAESTQWQPKWTMAIAGILLFSCAVGIGMLGAVHQFVWLFTSKEPWIQSWPGMTAREPSPLSESRNNLKQFGLAFHNYHDTNDGLLPPGTTFDEFGRPLHGWQTFLLPYLDQQSLYERIDLTRSWSDQVNADAFSTVLYVYQNPKIAADSSVDSVDAQGRALSHYAGNRWTVGSHAAMKLSDFLDGTTNTFLAGEVTADFLPWGHPQNYRDPQLGINKSPDGFGGLWKGRGANFLFADGSVRFLDENIAPEVLRALATPAGGEVVVEED